MGEVVRGVFKDYLLQPLRPVEAPQFKVDDEVRIHVKDLDMLTGVGVVVGTDKDADSYLVRFMMKEPEADHYEEEDMFFYSNELELYHE